MVKGFVEKYNADCVPDEAVIAHANDAVRWTPHATINLLRRSQLSAAKKLEAAAPNSKPNAIYARNVLRIIEDTTLLQ
jgi:16S rRNA C967 or C1407 C5-methylase (RsmB/RsmF family)